MPTVWSLLKLSTFGLVVALHRKNMRGAQLLLSARANGLIGRQERRASLLSGTWGQESLVRLRLHDETQLSTV